MRLSSSDHAGAYSFWLSAMVFAHLCSCSHKHRWNTVWWQQPSLIATHDAWTAADATRRAKHMLWGLVAQLWAPFSWRTCLVTAWLPTMNVIVLCWAPLTHFLGFISADCHRNHSMRCQVKWLKQRLYLGDSLSLHLLFQVHLHPIHSHALLQIYIDELRGESLGLRSPKLWSKSQE